MRCVGWLLLTAVLAAPTHGQARNGQTTSALNCGTLKAEAWKTGSTSQWTISRPAEKTTETGVLRSGPRFECLAGAILVVEFTSQAGHSFFAAYFADGASVGYGCKQIDRYTGPRSTTTAASTCRPIPSTRPRARTASSSQWTQPVAPGVFRQDEGRSTSGT
jgi:hypothetical protein